MSRYVWTLPPLSGPLDSTDIVAVGSYTGGYFLHEDFTETFNRELVDTIGGKGYGVLLQDYSAEASDGER